MHEISLAAERIFSIGGFDVTNTMIVTVLITFFLIAFALIFKKKFTQDKKISGLQNVVEIITEGALDLMDGITDNREQTKKYFALTMTLFLFIVFANWSGLLPGVGPIGIYEKAHAVETEHVDEVQQEKEVVFTDTHEIAVVNAHGDEIVAEEEYDVLATTEEHEEEVHEKFVPLFRAPSSDLNMTLALAIISLIAFQGFGIAAIGFFKYAGKFLNFKGPVDFFIGILEIIGEVAKMISLSFRLFGNVFAGEVLLLVIAFLVPLIAPLPFFALEIFVGLIQAFIFAMLTLVFLKVASLEPH